MKFSNGFIFQIYEVLSESTFFGVKEFFIFVYISENLLKNIQIERFWDTKRRAQLENYWNYFDMSDFSDYKEEIKEYIVIYN